MSVDLSAILTSPAAARNREPILEVLRGRLASGGRVLEVASGSGEHAVWFAQGLPGVVWRPSDQEPAAVASIRARREAADLPNLEEPLVLNAADAGSWPAGPIDAVVCLNMIHIAPWAAAEGLMADCGRLLEPGGMLCLTARSAKAGSTPRPATPPSTRA